MATGKYKKKDKGTNNANSSGSVHNILVSMGDDTDKNEPHVSGVVFFTVLVVCVVLVIVLPALGIMYMDMNNATVKAIEETKKMQELRLLILQGQ